MSIGQTVIDAFGHETKVVSFDHCTVCVVIRDVRSSNNGGFDFLDRHKLHLDKESGNYVSCIYWTTDGEGQ